MTSGEVLGVRYGCWSKRVLMQDCMIIVLVLDDWWAACFALVFLTAGLGGGYAVWGVADDSKRAG